MFATYLSLYALSAFHLSLNQFSTDFVARATASSCFDSSISFLRSFLVCLDLWTSEMSFLVFALSFLTLS